MTSRIDELFSPDKLRQNWQGSLVPVVAKPQNATNLDIHTQYQKLQQLVNENYPDASRLAVNFADLTAEIEKAFGLDAVDSATVKQKQAIVAMLEELEELLWAMDLQNRET